MRKTILIMLALFLVPLASADLVRLSTNITVDWDADKMHFDIETEGDDKSFTCNSSGDETWEVTYYRPEHAVGITGVSYFNYENFTDTISQLIYSMGDYNANLTNICGELMEKLNTSVECGEAQEAYGRVVANYDNCKEKVKDFNRLVDERDNLVRQCSQFEGQATSYRSQYQTCSEALKSKDSNLWLYLLIAAGVGAGAYHVIKGPKKPRQPGM